MIISLSGFMGCGKSSVGKALGAMLADYDLIDLDAFIEEAEGMKIPDIFKQKGEGAFRAMELKALEAIIGTYASGGNAILSLGGGTLTTYACAGIVHERTVNIYLKAELETLVDNLKDDDGTRPMLQGGEGGSAEERLRSRVSSLMAQRSAIYEATAKHILSVDGKTYDETAQEIKEAVGL